MRATMLSDFCGIGGAAGLARHPPRVGPVLHIPPGSAHSPSQGKHTTYIHHKAAAGSQASTSSAFPPLRLVFSLMPRNDKLCSEPMLLNRRKFQAVRWINQCINHIACHQSRNLLRLATGLWLSIELKLSFELRLRIGQRLTLLRFFVPKVPTGVRISHWHSSKNVYGNCHRVK